MWDIDFITEDDFRTHVLNTVKEYEYALRSAVNLSKFNENRIDPIKFMFDKNAYGISWKELIDKEIARQKDKTVNNAIGYFHQKIFHYFCRREGCTIEVPENGVPVFPDHGGKPGWDVGFENEDGIFINGQTCVHRIYAEVKNKFNTMNKNSSKETYKLMERQIESDEDSACFLVEAIARDAQDVPWEKKGCTRNKRIRRVSIDKFYGYVTGDAHAFMKICMKLPGVIQDIVREHPINPNELIQNTVYTELESLPPYQDNEEDVNMHIIRAIYSLAFGSYAGF